MDKLELDCDIQSVSAYAPASSANFIVGFDLIGFAIDGVGDTIKLVKRDDSELNIVDITGVVGIDDLPKDSSKNVVSMVIKKFLEKHKLSVGFDIYLKKGIQIGSGMGGSASSSVVALVALNGFLKKPLKLNALIDDAIYGESMVSGGAYHGDNVVASMLGGLVLLQSSNPCKMIELPTCNLWAAIVCPSIKIETKLARQLLKDSYSIETFVQQSTYIAAVIASLYRGDIKLLKENLDDVLVEPKRKQLIPQFDHVKETALQHDALGCSISGAGPSMVALALDSHKAKIIALAMKETFEKYNIEAQFWITPLDATGATILNRA